MVKHYRRGVALLATCVLLIAIVGAVFPVPAAADSTPVPPRTSAQDVGSTSWVKQLDRTQNTMAFGVLPTDDGGYFIVGETDVVWEPVREGNIYLLRIDAAGEVLWEQTYEAAGYQGGRGMIQADDGLLVVGVAESGGESGIDAYLMAVDQDGNELWSRTYSGPLDELTGGIVPAPDGGYLLGGTVVDPDDFVADPGSAGYGGSEGRSSLYVLKVDAAGNELWSKTHDNGQNVQASAAALTPDGGMLILANVMYYPDPGGDIMLLKLDAGGNKVWTRTWNAGTVTGQSMIHTSDDHFLISAAYVENEEDPRTDKADFMFIKIDQDGDVVWESVFGDPDIIDYAKELVETEDGRFLAVSEKTPDHYTWESELALIMLDAEGQYVSETAMPGAHTMFCALVPHADGGYLAVGSMYNGSVFNILLIKSDADGGFPVE